VSPSNSLEETCKALQLSPSQDFVFPEVPQFRKQTKSAGWISLYSEIFKADFSKTFL
jgi:hypothetical protein